MDLLQMYILYCCVHFLCIVTHAKLCRLYFIHTDAVQLTAGRATTQNTFLPHKFFLCVGKY